jgi:rare lipoprotein A
MRTDRERASMRIFRLSLVLAGLGMSACTSLKLPEPDPPPSAAAPASSMQPVFQQTGVASWYGKGHHGRLTASGERFDMTQLTAAHRSLELGTVVRVTNLVTGDTIRVRINDRGPYVKGRVIDVSAKAARRLGMHQAGLAEVRIEVFDADQEIETAKLD